jgi:superfamily II DNA or RNA helicase
MQRIGDQLSSGVMDVLAVAPTGAGKSVLAAHAIEHTDAPAIFIAHRAELISGESLALARNGVRHRIIGPPALQRECSRRHVEAGLRDCVDPNAQKYVASVATLKGLPAHSATWRNIRLVVNDECHHVLRDNMWGKTRAQFVRAASLGLTATPHRADGKGLGRHADGFYDVIVAGPTARTVELLGFLTPHIIYAPSSDLDLEGLKVTAQGDFNQRALVAATARSHIIGDVVDSYKMFADGELGMTFAVDVEACHRIAEAFKRAKIPAEVVTGATPHELRNSIFRRFRKGEVRQLVSCEIAGEGFDLPDVAVISLARATASWSLAVQQIGRVKRILEGKTKGIVIDHVGNVKRHCEARWCDELLEYYIAVGEREWTLDRAERRASTSKTTELINTCPKCFRSYERVLGRVCPYCAHEEPLRARSTPAEVEGVLSELTPAALAQLMLRIDEIDGPVHAPHGIPRAGVLALHKRHNARQEVQAELRKAMAQWGGEAKVLRGLTTDQAQRAFWLEFGIDVATAQTLGATEAANLLKRIDAQSKHG